MIANANRQAGSATNRLAQILQDNHGGRAAGVFSICSANRHVLEAGMMQALRDESLLLIESTSNQVNQYGGYTGQTPADFVAFVHEIAREWKLPEERIVLGGDHLGPHVWKNQPSASAMDKGCAMVREYVRAGYTKIHLDASMACGDDPAGRPLSDGVVSERATILCEAAELAHKELPSESPAPLYVVGTEVPIPGGEHSEAQAPKATRTEDLARTLHLAKTAFHSRGLEAAWERVIAVVVQPGVEFGDATVFAYNSRKAQALSEYLVKHWTGVYEAHSTDYQAPAALQEMVRDHFAILKVGPWLTFAFREAIFALAEVEKEWLAWRQGIALSGVREALERAMVENPAHWKGYYHGDESALRFARKYSYSDRSRYYWPQPEVTAAVHRLLANLTAHPAPVSLLSQYLPAQGEEMRSGKLRNLPLDLIRSKIMQVMDHYAFACGMRSCG